MLKHIIYLQKGFSDKTCLERSFHFCLNEVQDMAAVKLLSPTNQTIDIKSLKLVISMNQAEDGRTFIYRGNS